MNLKKITAFLAPLLLLSCSASSVNDFLYTEENFTESYSNGDVFTGTVYLQPVYKLVGSYARTILIEGTYTFANGNIYVGEFTDGLGYSRPGFDFKDPGYTNSFNGEGTFTRTDGQVYTGTFKESGNYGTGKITAADGSSFHGEFKNANIDGPGTYVVNDGIISGNFSYNGLAYGTKKFTNGDTYVGTFQGSADVGKGLTSTTWTPSGDGTLTYANGDVYTGQVKGFLRSRRGVRTSLTQPDGRGVYSYANRNTVSGLFVNGEIEEGEFTYPLGSTYVGELRNKIPGGYGTLTTATGEVFVGEWKTREFITPRDLIAATPTEPTIQDEPEPSVAMNQPERIIDQEPDNAIVTSPAEPVTPVAPTGPIALTPPEPIVQEEPEKPIVTTPADPIVPETLDSVPDLLQAASGSGFAVSYDGYIVTNNHVVEGCENVRIHKEGATLDSTVISRDPLNDLAVLKANFRPAAVFPIDDSNPELMQSIYVAGYPFGQSLSSSLKVTEGIVSSLAGLGNNVSNIQIDAAIQPGNSGGPIFDGSGNVIGVAVSSLAIEFVLENFDTIPQNTNFGVKANVVSSFLSSNNVEVTSPRTSRFFSTEMTTPELAQLATDATYYLSCWMTTAQIEEMSSTKVLFRELRN